MSRFVNTVCNSAGPAYVYCCCLMIRRFEVLNVVVFRPYKDPGCAYYPYEMESAVCAPVVYRSQADLYGFPVGTTGTFVPESLIYPEDKEDGIMIVPEEAIAVHCAPSVISEGPFETHLPKEVEHYIVDDCDPYNMKSYIRGPYESHIDELCLPPADYDDRGPYERRLPVAADPKMLNRNFIIRQSEDYRRRLQI